MAHRAIAGTMSRLNRVFEELGVHHEEHKIPSKVLKSLEDKEKKAAAKNTTAAAEAKKRKGSGHSKALSKKQKVGSGSGIASAGSSEQVGDSVPGGSVSAGASAEVDRPIASTAAAVTNLGGSVLLGGGGTSLLDATIADPMLGVLSDDSSSSRGGEAVAKKASALGDGRAPTNGRAVPTKAIHLEESEAESEGRPPSALARAPSPPAVAPQADDSEAVCAAVGILHLSKCFFRLIVVFLCLSFEPSFCVGHVGDLTRAIAHPIEGERVLPPGHDPTRKGLGGDPKAPLMMGKAGPSEPGPAAGEGWPLLSSASVFAVFSLRY